MDMRWLNHCTLMGCNEPNKWTAHHHHYLHGHLDYRACHCAEVGEPGTLGLEVARRGR